MKKDETFFRILDANFNRSREGLRVCEEIFRFFLKDVTLTKKLKKARHGITKILKTMPQGAILAARDIKGDHGKGPSSLEKRRRGLSDLFGANIERVKESLRVLEEFSKLLNPKAATQFKKLRFEVYEIEKKALPGLESLRHR